MASKNCSCKDCTVVEGIFGEIPSAYNEKISGETSILSGGDAEIPPTLIKSYTLTNNNHMEVVVITWGATIVSLKCPDKYGRPADLVLGFDDIKSYMNPQLNQFFGCVLGRCANRIERGTFTIKDKDYQLSLNENFKHHLNGGNHGFGRQVWEAFIDDCTVVMSYMSEDGEEGYPGAVLATIRFKLTADNKLEIAMRATTSKSTIVNLSHGSLFNLAGHNAGEEELKQHRVSLNCDRWTFTEIPNPVPNGAIRGVGGTVMDLRIPKHLGDAMKVIPMEQGFDHNFCVVRGLQAGVSFVARVLHPETGRILEVYSDQPGVNLYTGGHLPSDRESDSTEEETIKKVAQVSDDENAKDSVINEKFPDEYPSGENETDSYMDMNESLKYIPGKGGARYKKFHAFGIHPQNYPNAINISHFPCSILRPGQTYCHDLTYKFGVQLGNYMSKF